MRRLFPRGGKRAWRPAVLGGLLLLTAAHPAWAQKPPAAQGFDGFKMVRTRNIFDPDRRPPPSQNGSAASAVPLAQSDYVALTGTLVTNDKALAFFSGSRAEFDKVLPSKEKIAGATITKIDHGSVTLDRGGGKTATVAVGWTVPLNGAASAPAPAPAAAAPSLPAFGASVPAATGNAPPTGFGPPAAGGAAPAAPGAANPVAAGAPAATPPTNTPNEDVARMMRERRQREVQ